MKQQIFSKKITSLACLVLLFILSSCKKESKIGNQLSPNLSTTPKNISPDSFLVAPGKSIFYWQNDKHMCSNTEGVFYFKGFVYDTMDYMTREPIPYGDFKLPNKSIPHGTKDENYKYKDNDRDTLDHQYSGSMTNVSLENNSSKKVYDTSIKILEPCEVGCPEAECLDPGACLPIETNFNSDFAAVEVSGSLDGEKGRISNRRILSTGGEEGLNQVCLENLTNSFNGGDLIEVRIVRAKYYYVPGSNGQMHKLTSLDIQSGTFKLCQ